MPTARERRILAAEVRHIRCPDCLRIHEIAAWDIDDFSAPCPDCGGHGGSRSLWPPPEVRAFLAMVDLQDAADDDARRVATVFLASGCEGLLQDVLLAVAQNRRTDPGVTKALMRAARGRDRLLRTYKTVVGMSCKEVLQRRGLGDWFDAWTAVAESRNLLAHGGWRKSDGQTVSAVHSDAIRAFIALNNEAM